jgi:CheY-like chemotaxis protein
MVEEWGGVADVAEDGVVAVEKARATQYGLILMDIQMPRMDGIDAAREIRRISGYESTPIIAVTANSFEEDRQRCADAGMGDFIAKPISPDWFNSVVLMALDRSPATG